MASGRHSSREITNSPKICLAGNVKVGKSTIFQRLVGANSKEIEIKNTAVSYGLGHLDGAGEALIDPPGISSVFIRNEDEKLSRNLLVTENVKKIIQVLDGSNMTRSLTLALQYAEFGIPMIFVVNMDDLAQVKGISIDAEKLSVLFGVKVVTTVAREGQGIGALKDSLHYCAIPKTPVKLPEDVEASLKALSAMLENHVFSARGLAILLLNKDASVEKLVRENFSPEVLAKCLRLIESLKARRRRSLSLVLSDLFTYRAHELTEECVTREPQKKIPVLTSIGRYSTRYLTGLPIAFLVALAMYYFVGKFGAEILVGLMEGKVFGEWIIPTLAGWLAPLHSPLITDFFCGNFGLVSVGLGLAFGVLLPVLFTFYLFFGLLEDSGYMPRLSVLLDKFFRKMGLNGKGVLPILMGLSCITMAILTTRMLDTRKERVIATLLLLLGIPCAPLLAVMLVVFAKIHWSATLLVFGLIVVKLILMGFLANKFIPGERGDFILEIPAMRIPSPRLIFNRALIRLSAFMKEAVPVFLLAAVMLFVFDRLGGLNILRHLIYPLVHILLDLPEQSVEILIMSLIRREAGAALLEKYFNLNQFTGLQAVVILVVMTALLPCINALIVLFKEHGPGVSLGIISVVMSSAIVIGALVNFSCRALGVTF